jgi:arylsulfatase A-like enzyme
MIRATKWLGCRGDQVTLPQVLREAGYATGVVGKWHLGATPSLHPMQRGFQEMFGFLGGGHDYFRANPEGETREYLIPLQRDGRPAVESEYLTDALAREAAAFVRRHRSDPFFLYLAYNTPHTPQQVSDKYLDRFRHIPDEKRRNYAAMVSALDDGAGKVLSTLAELGLERDTLVFFLSDNGGPIAVNGSSNAPLRGAKGQVYEGGIRVPFVARWPGRLAVGKTYREPVISLDVFPTALAAAGVAAPSRVQLDGVNLLPYLEGRAQGAPHERLFWRTGGGVSYAVREGRYKLVRPAQGSPELFDLEADLGESRDLSGAKPGVRDRLLTAYERWNRELLPPRFESPQPAARKKAAAGA